jgi:tetratricopeptide (TPR) repeat protein
VGLAAIAVHSLIDYSLHKPANAFLLAALCGMSVAAVSIPSRSTRRRTEAVPESHEALLRQLRLRLGAVAGLMVLLVLAAGEVSDLRGELASARFRYFGRLADARRDPKELERAVEAATADAELVLQFDQNNPEAVGETSLTCLDWAGREDLGPLLRLRLGDLAARAGLLAVRAAPSDCDAWLGLARALAALGLQEQADICLERAQSLAPPGTVLRLLPQRVENGGQSSSDGLIVRFAAGERGRRSVGSRTG